MKKIEVFNYNSNNVRTVKQGDDILFCFKDVCAVLETENSRNVRARLKDKDVQMIDTLTNGGKQSTTFITEPALYKVLATSNSKLAEPFQEWLFEEVLPTIRIIDKLVM